MLTTMKWPTLFIWKSNIPSTNNYIEPQPDDTMHLDTLYNNLFNLRTDQITVYPAYF